MTIDTYPLLTPTLIMLNPIVNSEKPIFYDILIEDDDDEDGDVTIVTDNTTPKGIVNFAGNAIVDAKDEHGSEPRFVNLVGNAIVDAKNDYGNKTRSLV